MVSTPQYTCVLCSLDLVGKKTPFLAARHIRCKLEISLHLGIFGSFHCFRTPFVQQQNIEPYISLIIWISFHSIIVC